MRQAARHPRCLTLDDWLNAGEEVRNKRLQRLEPEFRTTRVVELMDLSLPVPEWRRDLGAGRANSVKARARDSGDLRSALTEFAPALRCHYPGQAVPLETDSETYVVLRLWMSGDFLLRRHRLRVGDFRYMRALP
jgi:hypothetical protein